MKTQPKNREKIFSNPISNKRLELEYIKKKKNTSQNSALKKKQSNYKIDKRHKETFH